MKRQSAAIAWLLLACLLCGCSFGCAPQQPAGGPTSAPGTERGAGFGRAGRAGPITPPRWQPDDTGATAQLPVAGRVVRGTGIRPISPSRPSWRARGRARGASWPSTRRRSPARSRSTARRPPRSRAKSSKAPSRSCSNRTMGSGISTPRASGIWSGSGTARSRTGRTATSTSSCCKTALASRPRRPITATGIRAWRPSRRQRRSG